MIFFHLLTFLFYELEHKVNMIIYQHAVHTSTSSFNYWFYFIKMCNVYYLLQVHFIRQSCLSILDISQMVLKI